MVIKNQIEPELRHATHHKTHWGFLILLLVLGIALAAGIVYELGKRRTQSVSLAVAAKEESVRTPVVSVGRVRTAPAKSTVELPSQTVALAETPIYARADGYIKQRPVDIGSRVKKGDLLLEIETPDLEQQIEQARATVAQSRAALQQLRASLVAAQSNLKLAKSTAARWQTLTDQGVFATQDLDEKLAALELSDANVQAAQENVHAAESTVQANEFNLKRLQDVKSYDRMVAPFDGIITSRSPDSDVGTLISSGSSTSSREIMRVAQINVLRVFVNIPQAYAPIIRAGLPAQLVVDDVPGRVFTTSVKETTHSVDSNSRTMLAVLLVDNKNEALLPGMYSTVRFQLPHPINVMMLPADALMLQSGGPRVAVVDENHKVHIATVTLGRDYGPEIEVNSGVSVGDMVVLSPNDAIREGVTVETKERNTK